MLVLLTAGDSRLGLFLLAMPGDREAESTYKFWVSNQDLLNMNSTSLDALTTKSLAHSRRSRTQAVYSSIVSIPFHQERERERGGERNQFEFSRSLYSKLLYATGVSSNPSWSHSGFNFFLSSHIDTFHSPTLQQLLCTYSLPHFPRHLHVGKWTR